MIRGVILASGLSKRMGTQKLLLPFKEHTIIEEVIKNTQSSDLDEVVIVFGEPRDVFMDISNKHNVLGLYNKNYLLGQSQSIIKGIEFSESVEAFMFVLGDQPFITKEVINKIIDVYKNNPMNIIVPIHQGKKGNPVLFPRIFINELRRITGDRGGSQIISKYKNKVKYFEIKTESILFDIDERVDYNRAKKMVMDINN